MVSVAVAALLAATGLATAGRGAVLEGAALAT